MHTTYQYKQLQTYRKIMDWEKIISRMVSPVGGAVAASLFWVALFFAVFFPIWDKNHDTDTAELRTEIASLKQGIKDYDELSRKSEKLHIENKTLLTQIVAKKIELKYFSQPKNKNENLLNVNDVVHKSIQTLQAYSESVEKIGLREKAVLLMLETGLEAEFRKKKTGLKFSQATQDLSNQIYRNYYLAKEGIKHISYIVSLRSAGGYQKIFIENMSLPIEEFVQKLKESPRSLSQFKENMSYLEKDLREIPPETWIERVIGFIETYWV